MKKLVVVGNGMAGVACVEQILKYRHDFDITIFGDETHVNYNRILLSSVLAYGLELVALRRMPTRVFGILMSLEPAAAAVAGLLVLDQRLGLRQVVALLLVSLASAGVTLGRREWQLPPQPLE